MKKIILCLLTYIVSFVMTCCEFLVPDEKLSMKRVDYVESQLRVTGYYYNLHNNPVSTCIMFLYRNGTVLTTRYYPSHNLDVVEAEMLGEIDIIRDMKISWGLFRIVGNSYESQEWVRPTEHTTVRKRYGFIQNDTTFHITKEFYTYNNKEKNNINVIWHFRQFANKPDSTNNFIK